VPSNSKEDNHTADCKHVAQCSFAIDSATDGTIIVPFQPRHNAAPVENMTALGIPGNCDILFCIEFIKTNAAKTGRKILC